MRGIPFSSSAGNQYFYDDDSGLIFPAPEGGEAAPAPYEGKLAVTPLGARRPPPTGVDPQAIRAHHLGKAYGYRHLILELTGQCNLRCRYCVYSEHYPFNRGYTHDRMSVDVARRAVDLFMENHRRVHRRNPGSCPILGFYGGEPLIAFAELRATVEHFQRTWGEEFPDALLTVTTNGLLFTEEVQDFLVEHEFSIVLSLDGDRPDHDRNRVTPSGEGSFDRIFANLSTFRRRHPDYRRLAISTCYDYKTDLHDLMRFFDREGLFVVNVSQINPNNASTYYAQFSDDDRRRFVDNCDRFHELWARSARDGSIERGSFLFSYVGISFANFAFHPVLREQRPAFLPYTSTCVPGEKLYVTADGSIHMCERINPRFPIGSLDDGGLDYRRIADLVDLYNRQVAARCGECPVTRFCDRCFATTAGDDGFELEEGFCGRLADSVRASLVRYADVVETRPEMLDEITIDYHRDILEKVGYVVE